MRPTTAPVDNILAFRLQREAGKSTSILAIWSATPTSRRRRREPFWHPGLRMPAPLRPILRCVLLQNSDRPFQSAISWTRCAPLMIRVNHPEEGRLGCAPRCATSLLHRSADP